MDPAKQVVGAAPGSHCDRRAFGRHPSTSLHAIGFNARCAHVRYQLNRSLRRPAFRSYRPTRRVEEADTHGFKPPQLGEEVPTAARQQQWGYCFAQQRPLLRPLAPLKAIPMVDWTHIRSKTRGRSSSPRALSIPDCVLRGLYGTTSTSTRTRDRACTVPPSTNAAPAARPPAAPHSAGPAGAGVQLKSGELRMH